MTSSKEVVLNFFFSYCLQEYKSLFYLFVIYLFTHNFYLINILELDITRKMVSHYKKWPL